MELRKRTLCMGLLLLIAIQISEARHSIRRRESENNYDDPLLADAAAEDEAQNDADGGDDEEEVVEGTIVTQPLSYNVTIGRDIRLECRVSPLTGIVVQWSKSGTIYYQNGLKLAAPERFYMEPNSTELLIKDVRQGDSGKYRCQIIQAKPTFIEHSVVVQEVPRIIRFSASPDTRLLEGSDLTLTCEVAGLPPPKIVWSRQTGAKDGNENLQEGDGEFSPNSVLIRNVRREHSGRYYCYAFNGVGTNQAELAINVLGKPRVNVHRHVVNSAVNVDAVLQCSVHEDVPLHIRWYKDGKLVEDSGVSYTVSTHSHASNLTITPNSDADFGTYTCEAQNEYGSHNKSIELVQNPVIEELEADGSKLSWIVHSHLPLEAIQLHLRNVNGEGEWKNINLPIPQSRGHIYEIIYNIDDKQVAPGKYQAIVKAKNTNSWNDRTDMTFIEKESQPEYIQHASVYRTNSAVALARSSLLMSVAATVCLFHRK